MKSWKAWTKSTSSRSAVKEAEKNLASGKQEMEKSRQAVEDSAASIRADLTRLEAELVTAPKNRCPWRSRPTMSESFAAKAPTAWPLADDGVCTGCGQQITLNMQNELRLSKLVFCKSCGRLLYLAGD